MSYRTVGGRYGTAQLWADVGDHVAVCGFCGYLGLWKKEDWSESQVLQVGEESVTSFTYFKGLFYFGLGGGGISVWSLENSSCIAKLEAHNNFVETLVVNDRVIASCSIDVTSRSSYLKVMGREFWKVMQEIDYEGFCSPQSLGIDHSKLACQLSMNKIELWDIDEDRCFRIIYFDDCYSGSLVIGVYLVVDKLTVVDTRHGPRPLCTGQDSTACLFFAQGSTCAAQAHRPAQHSTVMVCATSVHLSVQHRAILSCAQHRTEQVRTG
ncbi:hypothetical protein, partial [Devosia indica]